MAPVCDGEYGPFEGSERDRVVFGTYRETGTWSPELVALIARQLLGRGRGTLIDVGANLGLVSIPVARASEGRCIAFEPAPDNHAYLERNVARHGLGERIEVHAVALSDAAGRVAFELSPDNSGDHRISPDGARAGAGTVRVEGARLDDVLAGRSLQGPVVMKVDTQGAEARVLAGARATLERVDYLIVEYWPAGLRRLGDDVEALHGLLRAFSHGVVLDQRSAPTELLPLEDALASLAWIPRDGSDEGFFDLLLARSAQLPRF